MNIMILIRKIVYIKIKTSSCNTHFVITSLVLAITSYMYKDHYLYKSTHRVCFSCISSFFFYLLYMSLSFTPRVLIYLYMFVILQNDTYIFLIFTFIFY